MTGACGLFGCAGCSGCDPDRSPVEETDLQRMQRRKREEDALRAAGKPTLRTTFGDAMRVRRRGDR